MYVGDPYVRCDSQGDFVDDDGSAGHDVAGDFDSGICGSCSSACSPDVLLHSLSCAVPAGDFDCTSHMYCGWMLVIQGTARAKAFRLRIHLFHY